MILKSLAIVLALAATTATAHAQRGWETIGFKTVGVGTDRDTVRVRGNQRHRQVRICALNRAVQMVDVDVRYENGAVQDLPVRRVLNAGTCTAALDLRGRRRNIRDVQLTYAKFARGTLPVVRVQAR